jgi:aromatic ring-opening dioxygenase LigB subunit
MVVFYVFTLSVTVATVTGNAYPLSTTKTILPKMFWGECQTEREDNLFSTAVAIPVPYLSNCTLREKAHGLPHFSGLKTHQIDVSAMARRTYQPRRECLTILPTNTKWNTYRIVIILLVLALDFNGSVVVRAKLLAAVILPHGDFAYDPTLLPTSHPGRPIADRLASTSRAVGHWLVQKNVAPDVLFFSTPHGIALSNDFALYLGSMASGTARIGKDLRNASFIPYNVRIANVTLAPTMVADLIHYLRVLRQQNVSGVSTSPDDADDVPLHWAEVIPLSFLDSNKKGSVVGREQSALRKSHRRRRLPTGAGKTRQHLIWSHPLQRYNAAPAMVPELLHVGCLLRTWLEQRPETFAVVVSADLSHTHRQDGPYGYSNTSIAFDAALVEWASGNPCRNQAALLERARHLQAGAKSCGYTGLVLLHGILCSSNENWESQSPHNSQLWESKVWANGNATYFGMMAVSIAKNFEDISSP